MQFSSNKIDSINDIPDIDSIKLKDLNIHYHGGCSAYKGQGAGRRLTYRTSAVCNLGDILDSVWTELAIKTVERILGQNISKRYRISSVSTVFPLKSVLIKQLCMPLWISAHQNVGIVSSGYPETSSSVPLVFQKNNHLNPADQPDFCFCELSI